MTNNKTTISVQEAGRRGGQETSRRHGQQFYHDIGVKGGHKVRELVKKGRLTKESRLKKLDESLEAMDKIE
jgi:uncharacterized protein